MAISAYKRRFDSKTLGREAHVDVFELSATRELLFALFGGSGVDDEEYFARGQTVIPVFEQLLPTLAGLPCVLLHVTAPFDIPFNRFASEPAALKRWNQHVLDELFEPWRELPFFVSGFSGGVALALNGVHAPDRCLGAATFGADAIPPRFACPRHWRHPLQIYCGRHDRVCNHPDNLRIVEELEQRQQAERILLDRAGHRLADYATDEGLGRVLRFASGIVQAHSD
jgi:pimeloyl-ACP methyl ester carboxylesterase